MPLLTNLKGYRKWSVAVASLLLSFWLAMLGKLTAEWVQITVTIIAAFSVANSYEHSRPK